MKNKAQYRIVDMRECPGGLKKGIAYYHSKWGTENNFSFINDAILHSAGPESGLPRFYILLNEKETMIGCCGLVVNDLISRHDLMPWLCGLYVEEHARGAHLGNMLMRHAEAETKHLGYTALFLSTDHVGYYERYGWEYIGNGYEPSGDPTRIYRKILT